MGEFADDLDVLCIGNAIVDIIARCDETFLVGHGIVKGAMNLIDARRAELLYGRMGSAIETSGGSAGNTAAGIASFGGRAAFFGKVARDVLGDLFRDDIRAQGVVFRTDPLDGPPPTARSMILVTPDNERSMNTYLGACAEFSPQDVDADIVAAAKVTYFEGYLWDPPRARKAIDRCARIAHDHGREVAMTLSDPYCVDRHRDDFLALMADGTVDIVFANEREAMSLYRVSSLDEAIDTLAGACRLAIVTRGERGARVARQGERVTVPAIAVNRPVDTTGAGDLFAAGFLYGYTSGRSLDDCARLGCLAAGLVIGHIGPRPRANLRRAAIDAGLVAGA